MTLPPERYALALSSTANKSSREIRPAAKRKRGWFTATALSCMVMLATAGTAAAATTPASSPGSGGNALSGPADGGATGIVDTISVSGFTMSTATGIEVTVDETSSTKTIGGRAGDVRKGTSVLVLGLDDGTTSATTTITAAGVVIQPHGDGGAAAAKAAGVIPFEPGVPSPTQSVGTIPASYTQGQGTLVSGIQAYLAVAVAQSVFPGGVVDRVVQLSDGSYEVHNIGINWPHHVFVSSTFQYLGAE